jgi:hypothetical protein
VDSWRPIVVTIDRCPSCGWLRVSHDDRRGAPPAVG